MTADNDINSVFEKYTIKDIEELLSKMRNDIERKKEDLRMMVGERYRDLIEAADTISDMHESAEAICKNIQTMEGLCGSLRQRGLIGFKTRMCSSTDSSQFHGNSHQYSLANQVKLLVDVPEILWGFTEKKEYLNATQLFLLAQQAHTALQLSPNANEMLEKFPVISRQWSNIAHFRSTITSGCVSLIKSEINDCELVMKAASAMTLLEGVDPSQTLNKVLQLRKKALMSILVIRPSTTAKKQLVTFVVYLVSTFRIIHYVFAAIDGEKSRLERKIRGVTGETSSDAEPLPVSLLHESSLGLHFLPKSVVEFRPTIRWKTNPLDDNSMLRKETRLWLDTITKEASDSIANLLSCTTSIKALSLIRSSVWESQKEEDRREHWQQMVLSLLGEATFFPWASIIQKESLVKGQGIVRKELVAIKNNCLQMIKNLTKEIMANPRFCAGEGDVSTFVWSESSSDLPDQTAWSLLTAKDTSKTGEKMGLFYKSRGYTKNVQAVCRVLNSKLSALLEDVANYSLGCNENVEEGSLEADSADEDYMTILRFLEQETLTVFKVFLCEAESVAMDHFKRDEDLTVERDSKTPEVRTAEGTVVVTVSRLCQAIAFVCQNLKICAGASLLGTPEAARRVSLGVQTETRSWLDLKKNLTETSSALLSRFLSSLVHLFGSRFRDDLSASLVKGEPERLLHLFPMWERVGIQEEGEKGAVVESHISVPAHPNSALSKLLTCTCSSLNSVCAHTISRTSQMHLVMSLCTEITSVYEAVDVQSMNQTTALQFIFDLKLLQALLVPRESKELSHRILSLVQVFESCVDPFDLDVFSSHLNLRVKSESQRLLVLLGTIIPREKQPLTAKGVSSSSSSNNTLIIVPSVEIPRFSNVPLPVPSITRTTSLLLSPVKEIDDEDSPLPSTTSENLATTLTTSRSAVALFSAMSSSWFGGT